MLTLKATSLSFSPLLTLSPSRLPTAGAGAVFAAGGAGIGVLDCSFVKGAFFPIPNQYLVLLDTQYPADLWLAEKAADNRLVAEGDPAALPNVFTHLATVREVLNAAVVKVRRRHLSAKSSRALPCHSPRISPLQSSACERATRVLHLHLLGKLAGWGRYS